jgi:Rieske Fe-S protein
VEKEADSAAMTVVFVVDDTVDSGTTYASFLLPLEVEDKYRTKEKCMQLHESFMLFPSAICSHIGCVHTQKQKRCNRYVGPISDTLCNW